MSESESEVAAVMKKLARKIQGYKGQVQANLNKLDHNFETLAEKPNFYDTLSTLKRHFNYVDNAIQHSRELYIQVMSEVSQKTWMDSWKAKSDEVKKMLEEAEHKVEKAQQMYDLADQHPEGQNKSAS